MEHRRQRLATFAARVRLLLCRAAYTELKKAGSGRTHGGRIINVGSLASKGALAYSVNYCASKGGVLQLTHVGKYQGEVVAANVLGEPRRANYDAIPAVVYTDPQAASVGATEAPFSAMTPITAPARAKGWAMTTLKFRLAPTVMKMPLPAQVLPAITTPGPVASINRWEAVQMAQSA